MKAPIPINLPRELYEKFLPGSQAFKMDKRTIAVRGSLSNGEISYKFLSVVRSDRYPNWEEVQHAVESLLPPHVPVGLLLPRKSLQSKKQVFMLHLYELTSFNSPFIGTMKKGNIFKNLTQSREGNN